MPRLDLPLRFQRVFLEKVWGGRALAERPGLELPAGMLVGETWELVDRADHNSRVLDGPWVGQSLADLMRDHREDLLGRAQPNSTGRFPLLVKYLDASQALSVQVHPDEDCARRLGGGSEGKTEAWYFLGAAADGAVYSGLKPGVEAKHLEPHLARRGLLDLLARWPVQAGQSLVVEGGTVHAIGAGVTLLEVQQNSDTTYRLYDWDRPGIDGRPREMHTQSGSQAIRYGAPTKAPSAPVLQPVAPGVRLGNVLATAFFAMRLIELDRPWRREPAGQFRIYAQIGGRSRLETSRGAEMSLEPGDVLLLPAAAEGVVIEPASPGARLLELDQNR